MIYWNIEISRILRYWKSLVFWKNNKHYWSIYTKRPQKPSICILICISCHLGPFWEIMNMSWLVYYRPHWFWPNSWSIWASTLIFINIFHVICCAWTCSHFYRHSSNWGLVQLSTASKHFLFSTAQRLITGIKPLRLLVGRFESRFPQWEPVCLTGEQTGQPSNQPSNQPTGRLGRKRSQNRVHCATGSSTSRCWADSLYRDTRPSSCKERVGRTQQEARRPDQLINWPLVS